MTFASWITLSRLLAVPFLLVGLQNPTDRTRWICAAIFLAAAGTDWLDGYVARRFNQVTDLGKFLDPLVDKLLVLTPLLSLIELQEIPAWSVFLILFRELAIAGWRVQQTKVSGANLWGKAKTVSQIAAVTLLILPIPSLGAYLTGHQVALSAYTLAIVLTFVSAGIYVWPKRSASQPD
jgi:CDP-diacylglycerol---glycerol-3-phosphate 3-phosphatidyltransferase